MDHNLRQICKEWIVAEAEFVADGVEMKRVEFKYAQLVGQTE